MDQQSMILFYEQKLSHLITRISSLRVLVYNKMRENSITLTIQILIFQSSSLFQSNCIRRSNEEVKQVRCFCFPEMSWLLAEHKDRVIRAEGQVPCNRTVGRGLAKSNNLVFLSFDTVPEHIYLENMRRKHCLNSMRLALCLAMGSDRSIAKQGNSLLVLSLNRYVMTQIIYAYHFHQSQYFILRYFWRGNL